VDAFFWAALGFLVVSAVGGAVYVGIRAWRAWIVFTSFAAGGAANLEALAARAEKLGMHVERTSQRAEELAAATARLQRSLRRAQVLIDATADVRGAARAVLAFGR
jgi:UDP-N-acetylmuramyl pentapeptide synthase